MAEIPWLAWISVGSLIGIISLFLGFLRPVSYNAFFQLMFFIGLGMIIYGYIKMKIKEKYIIEELERRRASIRDREIEIDMDEIRQRRQNFQSFRQSQDNYQDNYQNGYNQNINVRANENQNLKNYNYYQQNSSRNEQNLHLQQTHHKIQNVENHESHIINQQHHNRQNNENQYNAYNFNQHNIHQAQSQHHSTQNQHRHYISRENINNKSRVSENRVCRNCGTPLLKEHKYCPICNQRV